MSRAGENSSIEIRPCSADDVGVLERYMPGEATPSFHRRRFDEQQRGESTYLVAWLDGVPVGQVNAVWTRDENLAEQMRAPELSALSVWPPEHRSKGIGGMLIEAGERLARARGFDHVAIGVGVTNDRAAKLYARLGYTDWGGGTYEDTYSWRDAQGVEHHESETCTWLVKRLAP